MFLARFKRSNQSGDTIVEVLIAIAVISLVLAAGYAIANRNVLNDQDTQERNVAQRMVQSQIESLRGFVLAGKLTSPANLAGGCMLPDGTNFATDAEVCSFTSGGATNCTEQPCYRVSIEPNLTTGIYSVRVEWQSLKGGRSSVSMEYGV